VQAGSSRTRSRRGGSRQGP